MTRPLQDNAAHPHWYLLIGDGLSVQVSSELVVGEDGSGTVALDPEQPEQRLIRLRVEPGDGLVLTLLTSEYELDGDHGALKVGDRLPLRAGTKVVLPHNELYFSHGLQRGGVRARWELIEADGEPDFIGPVEEIVLEALEAEPPRPQVTKTAQPPEPPTLTQPIEPILESPVRKGPPPRRRVVRRRSPSKWWWAIAVLLVFAGAVVVLQPGYTAKSTLRSLPRSDTGSATWVVDVKVDDTGERIESDLRLEPRVEQPLAEPVVEVTDTVELAPIPTVVERKPAEELKPVDPRVDRLVARARQLMDEGSIIAPPHDNAVIQLELVLELDPGNSAALAMISEAANTLVEAAERARAAGMDFEARNLIEEVRAFHPEHAAANERWRRWTSD